MSLDIALQEVSLALPDSQRNLRPILRDVTVRIAAGEFVCLLGPSGCGKTTLLNIIAGFLRPLTGSVVVGEQAITGPGVDRGVVFQEYGLFPWFTVQQNVEIGPRIRGMTKRQLDEVSQHYLNMVGLTGFKHYYPHQLSGGMRQRVSLARSLANEPQVLLLDEPFAALDAQTREELQAELLELWATQKVTCLFVTHSVDEAVYLGQRAIVLQGPTSGGSIAGDIAIGLRYERDRTSPEFGRTARQIYHQLGSGGKRRRRLRELFAEEEAGHEDRGAL